MPGSHRKTTLPTVSVINISDLLENVKNVKQTKIIHIFSRTDKDTDIEYMSAVKNGGTEKAQKLVDETTIIKTDPSSMTAPHITKIQRCQ